MAQIIRKWVQDSAINNEKLDEADIYTVTGLLVDSTSAAGRVGIGVTDPLGALHVRRLDTSAGLMLDLSDGSDGRNYQIYSGSTGVMTVRDHAIGIDRFTVLSNSTTGSIGVSVINPQDTAHLRVTTLGSSAALRLDLDDGVAGQAYRFASNPAGDLVIEDVDASAVRITIDSTGTTTIPGDTTVGGNFEVDGTVTVINTEIVITDQLEINQTDATQAALIASQDNAAATETVVKIENASAVSHALTVDQGNVGFGTTNPAAELHVEGDIVGKLTASPSNIGSTTRRVGTIFMASNIDYESNLDFSVGGVSQVTLDTTNGYVGIGTTTPGTPMDVVGEVRTSTILRAAGNILSTSGNIEATAGQVRAGTTMTAGTGITATTGNIVATAGQVNAGTSMTAANNITSTIGSIVASAGSVTAQSNVTANSGNIVATAGQVNAGTSMTAATNITATAGDIATLAGDINSAADMTAVAGISAAYMTSSSGIASSGNIFTSGDYTTSGNIIASTGRGAFGTNFNAANRVTVVETAFGKYGVKSFSTGVSGIGLYGEANDPSGIGVEGNSSAGSAVKGTSITGLAGEFQGNTDVTGNLGVDGRMAVSTAYSTGIRLRVDGATDFVGVEGKLTNTSGTRSGVYGKAEGNMAGGGLNRGVVGEGRCTTAGFGIGVRGEGFATGGNGTSIGVQAIANGAADGTALYAESDTGHAAEFQGDVYFEDRAAFADSVSSSTRLKVNGRTDFQAVDGSLTNTSGIRSAVKGTAFGATTGTNRGIVGTGYCTTAGTGAGVYGEGIAVSGNGNSIGVHAVANSASDGTALVAESDNGAAADFQGDVYIDTKLAVKTSIHTFRRVNVVEPVDNAAGVYSEATGLSGKGVVGICDDANGYGVQGLSTNGLAGDFQGNFNISLGRLALNSVLPTTRTAEITSYSADFEVLRLEQTGTSGTRTGVFGKATGSNGAGTNIGVKAQAGAGGTNHPFEDNFGNYSDNLGWQDVSDPAKKRNIRPITQTEKDMFWSALDTLAVKGYRFKEDTIVGYDTTNLTLNEFSGEEEPSPIYAEDADISNYQERFGLIADELPNFLENPDKKTVNAKRMTDFLVAICQMQKEKIIALESEVSALDSRIAALEG